MGTVLGIDLGTQSLKLIAYDFADKRIVGVASAPLKLRENAAGLAEQEVSWWIDALHVAIGSLDKAVRRSVLSIAVSGQQHGLVALDAQGRVIGPIKLWCDTTAARECDHITEAMGGVEQCIEAIGNPVLPGYTAGKLRQMIVREPERYAAMTTLLLPHDYINFYLTGVVAMEAGDASGTALFDIREREWHDGVIDVVDPTGALRKKLPPVRTRAEPIGTLLPVVAQALDLPFGIPVATGGGDNMMAAIGTGNVAPGRLTVSLGTSGTVFGYADAPVVDPRGEIAAFCSSTDGWLPLLCTMNCTTATEAVRNMLGLNRNDFERYLSATRPDITNPITVPYFNGERTPNLPTATGAFTGWRLEHFKPDRLLRSVVEGVTFALKAGAVRLTELGLTVSEIVLTGGGSRSAGWRQTVADVFALPVKRLAFDEGAAFGAALQALHVLEPRLPIEQVVDQHLALHPDGPTLPRAEHIDIYRSLFNDYRGSAAAIATLYGTGASVVPGGAT